MVKSNGGTGYSCKSEDRLEIVCQENVSTYNNKGYYNVLMLSDALTCIGFCRISLTASVNDSSESVFMFERYDRSIARNLNTKIALSVEFENQN